MVPLPSASLKEEEKISLKQLEKHLGDYPKYLLMPEGLGASMDGFAVKEIDRRFFGSAANHNRLLFTPRFWSMFREYEYVLMYHLDALVFRDELTEWCSSGVDYIGAPWIRSAQTPWVETERCGNGGFALYRIPSVTEVLVKRWTGDPRLLLIDRFAGHLDLLKRWLEGLPERHFLRRLPGDWLPELVHRLDHIEVNKRPNDYFWAMDAVRHKPDFTVGSVEQGLRFAFEADPRGCLTRNEGRLPFGAHAWERYDRDFWKGILSSEGEAHRVMEAREA